MSGFRPPGGLSSTQEGAVDSIVNLEDDSIPKALGGELVESSTNEDPATKEWLFNKSIEVPQASIKISDTLSISEATLLAITRDKVQSTNIIGVSSAVDDISGSSRLTFEHVPSVQNVIAQPNFGTNLTSNPLVVPLLSTLSNQTDAVTLRFGASMTNFRATIVDNLTNITLKYIPSREAIDTGVGGLSVPSGDVTFDFNSDLPDVPLSGLFYLGFTPLRQFAGQASTLTFFADTIDILGEPGGIPYIENKIHFLEGTTIPFTDDVTNLSDPYTRLNNKYTGVSGVTSGIVSTYLADPTTDVVSTGQFINGSLSVSNPTVETVNNDTFSQGDLIQISGTVLNDGLYEVEEHTGTLLTVRGVGVTSNIEDFTKSDFIETVDSASITKVNISIVRVNGGGKWEQGRGSSTPLEFVEIDLFGSEYQYESDEALSSTTSMTFQNKLTLTTGVIPFGKYRISGTVSVTNSLANQVVISRVLVDGVSFGDSSYSPKTGDNFLINSSFTSLELTNDTHEIELEFRSGGGGGTSKAQKARLELFRVE